MKKILLASTLALCVTSAFAADPSAVLNVKGTLTNAACTPELGNGGVVDYGFIRLGELSATEVNQIGQKNIDLKINCTSDTKVGFSISDDRYSSKVSSIKIDKAYFDGTTTTNSSNNFGAGVTADNVKIGSWALSAKTDSITADGNAVDFIQSLGYAEVSDMVWTSNATKGVIAPTGQVYTAAASGTLEPVAFKTATFPLVTTLAIQDTTTLAITDDTPVDGQATITLRYL